jgi:hypothetical protein
MRVLFVGTRFDTSLDVKACFLEIFTDGFRGNTITFGKFSEGYVFVSLVFIDELFNGDVFSFVDGFFTSHYR